MSKKVIHKDFHGALSVAFDYILKKYGKNILEEYLKICARKIYRDLIEKIKKEGISTIEDHWKHLFSLEDAEFTIEKEKNRITLEILKCPAIYHIRTKGYLLSKEFCLQCHVINREIGKITGFKSEVYSEKGKCIQIFEKIK